MPHIMRNGQLVWVPQDDPEVLRDVEMRRVQDEEIIRQRALRARLEANVQQFRQGNAWDFGQAGQIGQIGQQAAGMLPRPQLEPGQVIPVPGPGVYVQVAPDQIPYLVPANNPEPVDLTPEEDKKLKLANTFLIGCDPEMLALDKNGNYISLAGIYRPADPMGYDHGGTVMEMHPKPAKSSYTLLKHLWGILKEAAPVPNAAKYRAGAYLKTATKTFTLGGHVHIDLPLKKGSVDTRYRTLALDELTNHFEQLDILPSQECADRRKEGVRVFNNMGADVIPYGDFGDMRKADNADRMEYRTMASWMFSPVTAYLALTAAKLTALAPKETLALLAIGDPSPKKIRTFFEMFSGKDVDAKRIVEKVLERNAPLQRPPDADVMKTWNLELAELA